MAWAFSMAAGEYVSVSSQVDIESADLEREKVELGKIPEIEAIFQQFVFVLAQIGLEIHVDAAIFEDLHCRRGKFIRNKYARSHFACPLGRPTGRHNLKE